VGLERKDRGDVRVRQPLRQTAEEPDQQRDEQDDGGDQGEATAGEPESAPGDEHEEPHRGDGLSRQRVYTDTGVGKSPWSARFSARMRWVFRDVGPPRSTAHRESALVRSGMAVDARTDGTVTAVRGSVIDVRFPAALPELRDVLLLGDDVVAEVFGHLDQVTVRCLALTATQGLARGAAARPEGGPIRVP